MIGSSTRKVLKDFAKRYRKYQFFLFLITIPLVLLSAFRPFLLQRLIDMLKQKSNYSFQIWYFTCFSNDN